MFEAFALVCALDGPDQTCRQALLPGHAAATAAECSAALAAGPPGWLREESESTTGCLPRPASALDFAEAAPGLWVHRGDIAEASPGNAGDVSNIAFVIGAASVAVIDSGGARQIGEEVYLAIRERTELPISHLILTHMHPDHILGASALAELGATIVGHAALPRALADRADTYMRNFGERIGTPAFLGTRIVPPDLLVEDELTLDLGSRPLRLRAWPMGHSPTDLSVEDVATGTLIAGDLVFEGMTPSLDGSLLGWQTVTETLQNLPAARAIPGHGGPVLPWPDGADPQMRYLDVLAQDTRAALAAGLTLSEAADTVASAEAGQWQLFELFNPRNATVAYTELEWE